jgi:dienelactone hydrolase
MRAAGRRSARRWALTAFLIAVAFDASPGEVVSPRGLIREQVWIPFRESDQPSLKLEAMLVRPVATGQHPLVLISHGSPRAAADAKTKSADWADWIANDFARRGYVVATVLRRGYGRSGGNVTEGYGTCKNPNYRAAGLATAQDLIQAISYFQRQPYVDPSRVLLIGVSAGGFGSIATASLAPTGLVGVINFAGGRGSPGPDVVCRPDDLISAYGIYGRTVRVRSLWIYAENDHFFGPDLARRMFAAFTQSGAPADLVIAPPYQSDGHNLIFAQSRWRDAVYAFLKRNHLPSDPPQLQPPPRATPEITQAFKKYLATPNYEKAFVTGDGGRYGWASGKATAKDALAAARKFCSNRCDTIYAVDDTLAEQAPASAESAGQIRAPKPAALKANPDLAPAGAGSQMLQQWLKQTR